MVIRSNERDDSGSNMIEYGALVVLVVIILAALVPVLDGSTLPNGIKQVICEIFSGGDCGGDNNKYKPPACAVSSSLNAYTGTLAVTFIRVGGGMYFYQTTDSTGRVTLIAVNQSQAGVTAGIGAGLRLGKVINAGAGAGADATLQVGAGDSWTFDNQKDANKFIGDIKKKMIADNVEQKGGVLGWIGGEIYEHTIGPEIPPPTITRGEVSVGGSAGASAGVGLGPGMPPKGGSDPGTKKTGGTRTSGGLNLVQGQVAVDASEKAITEHNNETGSNSVTYQITGGGNVGGQLAGNRLHRQVQGRRTGQMKLTWDSHGKLTGVAFIQWQVNNKTSTITTTHVPIQNAADRAAAYKYLGLAQGVPSLKLTWDDMAPTKDPGPNANPFQKLMYQKAQTSRVNYDFGESDTSYGANVELGAALGLGVGRTSFTQNETDAQYLGAPGPDGQRHYVPWKECHR